MDTDVVWESRRGYGRKLVHPMITASLSLLCGFILSASQASAQIYTPKPGESVLKLEVEGRGNIFIRLHPKEAPKTVRHIVALARQGFYSRQRFHKVVRTPKPFLVQIGDPSSKSGDIAAAGGAGTGSRIPYEETGFKNVLGAVGLIRNLDDMNSGDCQFYMLLDRSTFLDGNYTVFGQIVVGLDVLKKIQLGDRLTGVEVLTGEPIRTIIKPTAMLTAHPSGRLRLVD